jgi:glycosyltransferase involved in cell wall biosynthesis
MNLCQRVRLGGAVDCGRLLLHGGKEDMRAVDGQQGLRVVYLSKGNIPSKFAHTVQIMKMAEGLAQHVESLQLVTAAGFSRGPDKSIDLYKWYDVEPTFRVLRIPVRWRQPALMRIGNDPRFEKLAALYARVVCPHLVYARSITIAQYCVNVGLRTIIETHGEPKKRVEQMLALSRHPKFVGLVTIHDRLKGGYVEAGVPDSKIYVASSAVDLKCFQQMPDREVVRKELGLPDGRPIVVYCGHFYEKKGVPHLIDAAKSLRDVTFCLVGGWPEDIEAMKIRAGDSNNIVFTGFVPNSDVARYLAAADVLVLPNSARTEHAKVTSPLKLFEYMAAARPIVATRIPALQGFLVHSKNSYLVEPDSAEALASGIRILLSDGHLAQSLAKQALLDVQPFTWQKRAENILMHYGFLSRGARF